MRGEVIALDLETTGLIVNEAEIIEVGIALCRDNEILKTYQTMVKPEAPIPAVVTNITGITNEDVQDAPDLQMVLPQIIEFIGDRPIIGHNIAFDLAMLNKYGAAKENPSIDTYEMAATLLPSADRYGLGNLVEFYGMTLENAHRALDDAIASWQIYRKLWERIFEIRLEVLSEIVENAKPLDWAGYLPFDDALQQRLAEAGQSDLGRMDFSPAFQPSTNSEENTPLNPKEVPHDLDVHELSALLEEGGGIAAHLPGFEYREAQITLLQMVGTAFNRERHLLFETPTGIGKSLGYLLPAVKWAVENEERVVVSVYTESLKQQLLTQILPLIQQVIPVRVMEFASRRNYLCPQRLEIIRRRQATSIEELRILAKVLVWMSEGGSGVRDEINVRGGQERSLWNLFSAQEDDCTTVDCQLRTNGGCPFFKAQHRMAQAHILVVNHGMLCQDLLEEQPVLPPYHYLVMDEAHFLENIYTRISGTRLDRFTLLRRLSEFGDLESGILGDLLTQLDGNLPENRLEKIRAFVEMMTGVLQGITKVSSRFFENFNELMAIVVDEENADNSRTTRITPQTRLHPAWEGASQAWRQIAEHFETLEISMEKVGAALEKSREKYNGDNLDELINNMMGSALYLRQTRQTFNEWMLSPQANRVYWLEFQPRNDNLSFFSAPLHVGEDLEKRLWESKRTIALISDTFQVEHSFDYIDDRLNTKHLFDHASAASPIDYLNSALVYLVNDIPEPSRRAEYQVAFEQGLIDLATVSEGRMLSLFTNFGQMSDTAQAIAPQLKAEGIEILDESIGAGLRTLVENFVAADKAVLFGAGRFWEEVDVAGDDLQVVTIAKLPFEAPSDPIFSARSESYGDNHFQGYMLPTAILKFRMGFGRLVRQDGDRGIFVIFDRRATTKKYGNQFLGSLPRVTIERGPLAKLKHIARDWLNQ